VRVHLLDPPGYTPPYDNALAAALRRAGADAQVLGPEVFYPRSLGPQRVGRLLQHVPSMLRYRRRAREVDIVHVQWAPVQAVDWALLPRPFVITAHDVLPREPRPAQSWGYRRLYDRAAAVVVHSEHGARRLRDEAGVPAEKVHVIPHGAFEHLAAVEPAPLPFPEPSGPVVLFFGLIRPYKGLDVLLEAWRDVPGAELWVVGKPLGVDLEPLRSAAPATVRWLPRFVSDAELAAVFGAATAVVLPYREIDQSGVLFTAMAFGKPLIVSDVGGFSEVGAQETVPAGDPAALAAAIRRVLADPRPVTADPRYSWDNIAHQTLTLYEHVKRR
jgi:glycosyltransferase involved in cell wall biosynthesis